MKYNRLKTIDNDEPIERLTRHVLKGLWGFEVCYKNDKQITCERLMPLVYSNILCSRSMSLQINSKHVIGAYEVL